VEILPRGEGAPARPRTRRHLLPRGPRGRADRRRVAIPRPVEPRRSASRSARPSELSRRSVRSHQRVPSGWSWLLSTLRTEGSNPGVCTGLRSALSTGTTSPQQSSRRPISRSKEPSHAYPGPTRSLFLSSPRLPAVPRTGDRQVMSAPVIGGRRAAPRGPGADTLRVLPPGPRSPALGLRDRQDLQQDTLEMPPGPRSTAGWRRSTRFPYRGRRAAPGRRTASGSGPGPGLGRRDRR
jgi:hypothetical protein